MNPTAAMAAMHRRCRTRACLFLALHFACLWTPSARSEFALRDGDTVVFLGDSITAARNYTKIVEHYTLMRFPERKVRFINAGQGGDTASGCVQRLERDVFNRGATVVTVAFGINDIGWGMKTDAEHKQEYLDGIRTIIEQCQARKVRPFICSAAITAEAPDSAEQGFLQKMTDEGLALAKSLGAGTIDLQRGMRAVQRTVLAANRAEPDAKKQTRLHAEDGVHLNELGQLAMAYAMLKGLGAPTDVSAAVIDAATGAVLKAQACQIREVEKNNTGLQFTRLDEGLPLNLGILSGLNHRWVPIPEGINRYLLTITNLLSGDYELRAEGRVLGRVTAERLARGLNISSMTADAWAPGGPWDAQSGIVKELVDARDKLWMAAQLRSRFLENHPEQSKLGDSTKAVDEQLIALQRATAKPYPYGFTVQPVSAATGKEREAVSVPSADPAALERAFAHLARYDWHHSREPLQVIEAAVVKSRDNSTRRQELEKQLADLLTSTAPRAAKCFACRSLSLIGTGQSVPALANLLLDPELSHMSRLALERIGGDVSVSALRDALPKASGPTQAGIINSIGNLANPKAVPSLVGLLARKDNLIAEAATLALAKIGSPDAVRALERTSQAAPPAMESFVEEALIMGAENLLRRGHRAEALRCYQKFTEDKSSERRRLAGFRGQVLAQSEPGAVARLLQRALASDSVPLRKLAMRMLIEPPGSEYLKSIAGSSSSLPPKGQAALLEAIQANRDPSMRRPVLTLCESQDLTVRAAALRALSAVGNAEDVPFLATLAAGTKNAVSEAGRFALCNLPGRAPTRAMVSLLKDESQSVRTELIHALAARFATDAAPEVVKLLVDPAEQVRLAALQALASVGDETQISAVLGFLEGAPQETERAAAERTLESMVDRAGEKAGTELLARLETSKPSSRMILLQQVGRIGGEQGLRAVASHLKHSDPQVRDTAFRIITAWPDSAAVPELLRLTPEAESTAHRALALGGIARLSREAANDANERLKWLRQAAEMARSNEEKLQVISALADQPHPGALEVLSRFLDNAAAPTVVDAAAVAVLKRGASLEADQKQAAVPVLRRLLKAGKNEPLQKQARDLLRKLGVPED